MIGLMGESSPLDVILIVEDNADLRTLISKSLARSYQVETAQDGREGLEKAYSVQPNLVLADIMMPRLDGYQLCRKLRDDAAFDKVPILLLTAKTGTDAIVKGLESGADDYVPKPFNIRELQARIAAHLRARRMERSLDERESRLAAIGQTTSGLAHDLRNRLMVVVGYAQLLNDSLVSGDFDKELQEDAKRLQYSANKSADLLQEMIDFAKGGGMDLELRSVAIRPALEAMHGRLLGLLEPHGIALKFECEGDASVELLMDWPRMERVVENLVLNARQALMKKPDQGEIRMGLVADEAWVTLRVADNGPGIAPEIRSRLFEPFVTDKSRGTGLGLATVKNLVTAHGGEIRVDDEPPEGGAAFSVRFRRQADED